MTIRDDRRSALEAALEQLEPAAAEWPGVLDEKTVFSIAISLRRIADMMAADRRPKSRSITQHWLDPNEPDDTGTWPSMASEHSQHVLHPIIDEENANG